MCETACEIFVWAVVESLLKTECIKTLRPTKKYFDGIILEYIYVVKNFMTNVLSNTQNLFKIGLKQKCLLVNFLLLIPLVYLGS